jgi:hypothetical protein
MPYQDLFLVTINEHSDRLIFKFFSKQKKQQSFNPLGYQSSFACIFLIYHTNNKTLIVTFFFIDLKMV